MICLDIYNLFKDKIYRDGEKSARDNAIADYVAICEEFGSPSIPMYGGLRMYIEYKPEWEMSEIVYRMKFYLAVTGIAGPIWEIKEMNCEGDMVNMVLERDKEETLYMCVNLVKK